jgi:formylglycine-generating enzyme required for sulfatase activity
VTAWYLAQGRLNGFSPDSVVERTRDLQQAVLSKSLRLLASNPLLLTTMAIIHLRQVRLPNERVRLYSQAVQVLLDGWQKQKGIAVSTRLQAVLSDSSKMRLIMQRLAYELHQRQSREGAEAHLSRYDILAILETPAYLGDIGLGDELLSYIDQRAGLLVGLGGVESGPQPQLYNFPHRTFQEYLAGCYMATGRETSLVREYRRRAREGDYWYLAGQLGAEALLYSDRPDTERLLDLAYALCPVELPREEGEWRAVHWSGQMATLLERQVIEDDADADGGGGRAYLERLSSRLVQILAQQILSPLERAEVGQALARLGDPRPGVGLRPNGLPDITWCEVPAGPFVMGEGKAERQVELPGFNISRYSITNAQYEAFVKDGGYTARWRRCWTKTGWQWKQDREEPDRLGGVFDLPNHPAAGISWYEAVAFCRWLTGKLRAAGEISQQVEISLPGESQWEKAARGTDGRVYPWGNQASPDRANYYDTGIGTTSAVGCFPNGASPYGCEEMAGNVREWCRTKYDKPDDDSLEGEALRVMRGGGFLNNGQNVRSAVRLRSNPNGWYNDQGFRVVASPFLTLASEPSEL